MPDAPSAHTPEELGRAQRTAARDRSVRVAQRMAAAARTGRRPSKTTNRQLAAKLKVLEGRIAAHDNHIEALFQAVRSLLAAPEKPKRKIGFARD